jgi:uncharacterized protein YbjT (DUF2867 family)
MLLADPHFETIATLTRRALPPEMVPADQARRLEQRVVDFDHLSDNAPAMRADAIICALGTTIEQAGSRQRFREVDFGYPLTIARLGLQEGATHFLLVSALGASSRSLIFYNRVKGELEDAVLALPYRSVSIVRPSLLVGNRAQPRRGEQVVQRLAFLVPARYKPIPARAVAAALVRMAREDLPGQRTVESRELLRFA